MMRNIESCSKRRFESWRKYKRLAVHPGPLLILAALVASSPLYEQSPWEQAVDALKTAFTGPIAKGLSLVAIVVGGLMFAFGEGESKRMLAGIVFGVGMAIGAASFMTWLFG